MHRCFFMRRIGVARQLCQAAALLFAVVGFFLVFVPPACAQYPGGGGGNGNWKIEVLYAGQASSAETDTGNVAFSMYQNMVSGGSPGSWGIAHGGSVDLSLLTDPYAYSTDGTSSGKIHIVSGAQYLRFPGPVAGTADELIQLTNAKIQFRFTWQPKNNNATLDPAPPEVRIFYQTTRSALGSQQGSLTVTSSSAGLVSNQNITYTDSPPLQSSLWANTTNGVAIVEFSVPGSIHRYASGNSPAQYQYSSFIDYQVNISTEGFAIPRGLESPVSGNNTQHDDDPSFTRWLPLSFSPQMNSQPFRTQSGALPAPWGNVNCYYSIRLNQEPTPPNYDLFGSSLPYIKIGGGYQIVPGVFVPAYTITDANGARLVFNSSLQGYTDVSSLLSYNSGTGVYTLSNAGPPGAMKQKGDYTYTFSGSNLTSISDDLFNQQTLTWSSGDPFLTVSDSSSGRSLVFHSPSSTSYLASMDAKGPTGAVNTHTVLTYDAGGHLNGNKVYDSSGIVLLHQSAYTYGGANGDAIITASRGVAATSFTYVTDSTLVDPFGLGTDRIASSTFGSSSDFTSSDNGGSIAGTYSYTWGPTQQGYNSWGVDAHTNTFTDARGNVFSSLFSLAHGVYGDISGFTNTGPNYSGAAAGSNRTIVSYTPSIVKPTSISVYDPLYYAGVTTNGWSANFDANGNISSALDPYLNQWLFGYNVAGTQLTSFTDPTNLTWNFGFGENGNPASRLTSVTDPANARRLNAAYNSFGQLSSETVPAAVSASGFDESSLFSYFLATGDLNTVTDPVGDVFQINNYDLLGDPLSFSLFPATGTPATEPAASWLTTSLTYDAAQNITNILAPNGIQGVPTYNNGVLTQLQIVAPAAMGGATLAQETESFDSRGRFYKVQDSLGTQAEYRYDKTNNITKIIDGRTNVTQFTFGQNNEPTSMLWPDGHTRSRSYDVAGRVSSSTDERGITSNVTMDSANRLTALTTPNQSVQLSYDAASRLLRFIDGTGQTQFNRDATLKRLQSVSTTISALPAGNQTFTTSYTYFGDGKVATMTSVLGQTSYSYLKDGSLSSQTSPFGGTTNWLYDHAGRMTRQTTTTASGSTIVTNYIYGSSGLTGDPSTAPCYLSQITQSVNNQTVASYTLQHSLLGQLKSQVGTAGSGENALFSYDIRGRLLSEALAYNPDAQHSYSLSAAYVFDNSNNLQGGSSGWSYNTSNQVTIAPAVPGLAGGSGLAYDAAGNLVAMNGSALTWSDLNWLASAGGTTFTVDAAGRRVSKTSGGVTTYYLYDGYTPIAELNASGQVVRGYTWGVGGIIGDNSASGSRFYLYDGVGNTRSLISSTGQTLGQAEYTAFGSVLASSGQTTPYGWQGQSGAYTDSETGLVLLTFRYYSPALGRFISRDPSGFLGGMNLYGYCTGDPVNACDASGLNAFNWVGDRAREFWGWLMAAPGRAAHVARRTLNYPMKMSPDAPNFKKAYLDGSCEVDQVNLRFHHVGNSVGNGIDEINGMIGVNVICAAPGLGLGELGMAGEAAGEGASMASRLPDFSGQSLSEIEEHLGNSGFAERPLNTGSNSPYRIFEHTDGSRVSIDTAHQVAKVNGPKVWGSVIKTRVQKKFPTRYGPHNQPYIPEDKP